MSTSCCMCELVETAQSLAWAIDTSVLERTRAKVNVGLRHFVKKKHTSQKKHGKRREKQAS